MIHPKCDPRLVELYWPCFYCKHVTNIGYQDHPTDPEALQGWTCGAFPNGIPLEILRRELDHTEPLPNQVGNDTYESKDFQFDGEIDTISFQGRWASHERKLGEHQ